MHERLPQNIPLLNVFKNVKQLYYNMKYIYIILYSCVNVCQCGFWLGEFNSQNYADSFETKNTGRRMHHPSQNHSYLLR